MAEPEKIKMNLNIGDQRLSLTVPFAKQDFTREVESEVDTLYRRWRKSFPAKTDREILAMVAYQYASFYSELKHRYEDARHKAKEILGDPNSEEAEK
ncbi:MAG: cell division protein ZapA [Candidatus Amulumruptor caecigallinarius]|nr:cell division protein ZapA [Candidatus Amulumruptor caecigallinarius]